MKRDQLEHIIRACANIADDDEIIVIGSQSVLGQHPDAPAELTVSNEADVCPARPVWAVASENDANSCGAGPTASSTTAPRRGAPTALRAC